MPEILDRGEYLQNLDRIWYGEWGSENRSPIHRAAEILADEYDAEDDISEELAVIASAMKGEDMRVAIHDALYKLGKKKDSGEYDPHDFMTSDTHVISDSLRESNLHPVSFPGESIGMTYAQMNGDPNTTQENVEITVYSNCILLGCVMHRGPINIVESGWSELIDSMHIDPTDNDQTITVFAKSVSSGTYSITAVSEESKKKSIKIIALYGVSGVRVVDNVLLSTVPYSASAKTDCKKRLYLASSQYASGSGTPMAITFSNLNDIDAAKIEELRFSAVYEYGGLDAPSPEISYWSPSDYISNSMNVITIDLIEEE